MTLYEIKKRIICAIEENYEWIINLGDTVRNNPELGYCEEKTSALVREVFDKLKITYVYPVAMTGVKAKSVGRSHGLNVCIMGEMDALRCAGNHRANVDGNTHACGHNAQIAAMLGAAIGLEMSKVMKEIDGTITYMAIPAEEFIDLEYREKIREQGKIQYFGGKQQLIAEGVFNDVDMAMMIHAQPKEEQAKLYVRGHNLGFLAKTITFHGKAAHGSTPFDGVNALNASALAILGMHSNRETFREEDRIRIHPIITKGGEVVNSVPDEVCMDTYVRGATLEAINKGNVCVERSCEGAATMVGATVTFKNTPGYLPLKESMELSFVMEENAKALMGENSIVEGQEITGSTDAGDLSHILPVIQPSIGGFIGGLHSKEFDIANKETAYIIAAKLLALTAAELLYNNCEKARNVKSKFVPHMTKEQYIEYLKGK